MTYLEPIPPKKHIPNSASELNEYTDVFSRKPVFVLTEREAEAASPEAMAVCGEEDPGEGLEFLVADVTVKP